MGTHQRGFNVMGVKKGADSIKFGIDIMQEQNFLITETSLNLIKEFRHYAWAKDKLGMQLNKPIDDYNHGIDAVRYFAMMELSSMRGNYDVR
jgi:phage terminase large subunit